MLSPLLPWNRSQAHLTGWRSPPSWLGCTTLLTLTMLVGGCTSLKEYVQNGFKVGPNYGRPPAPVATDWIDAGDQRLREETGDTSQWWTVFNDAILDSLICNAAQQNLTLREAGFRVLQSRAQFGVAVGNLFPQSQAASGGFAWNAISSVEANRRLFENRFLGSRFFGQYDLGFGIAWELDFWGRYRRAIEAADADLDASIENYDDVLVTLLGDVATAYVQIRILQDQIRLARANVELQRQTLKLAEARFKAQAKDKLDVDQSISTLAQTEALIPQLQISLRQASNQLCILLGIPPEDLVRRLGEKPIPTAPGEVIVGIPADLLRRRPDVRRAERQAAAESARIGVAESDFYPQLSLSGSLGTSAQFAKDLFVPEAFTGQFGPAFQWPLLNYGRIWNTVRQQDARFQQAVAQYQNTVLQANGEVENGIVTFRLSHDRVRYLTTSVKAAEEAVGIAVAQYKGGTVDFNRVALLQQNLVQQQDLLAQAQGDIALGLVQVYRALGGGWELRLHNCDCAALPEPRAEAGKGGAEPLPLPSPAPEETEELGTNPNLPSDG